MWRERAEGMTAVLHRSHTTRGKASLAGSKQEQPKSGGEERGGGGVGRREEGRGSDREGVEREGKGKDATKDLRYKNLATKQALET